MIKVKTIYNNKGCALIRLEGWHSLIYVRADSYSLMLTL